MAQNLTKIVEGMFSIEERKHSKTHRNTKNKNRNGCREKNPLPWSVDQRAVKNKDIAMNHDSCGQETVKNVDEETKTWKEPAEGRTHPHYTESKDCRHICQTQETVGQDHLVEEGQTALPDSELYQSNIDDDNGCDNGKPKYLEKRRGRLPKHKICFIKVESAKRSKLPVVHLSASNGKLQTCFTSSCVGALKITKRVERVCTLSKRFNLLSNVFIYGTLWLKMFSQSHSSN